MACAASEPGPRIVVNQPHAAVRSVARTANFLVLRFSNRKDFAVREFETSNINRQATRMGAELATNLMIAVATHETRPGADGPQRRDGRRDPRCCKIAHPSAKPFCVLHGRNTHTAHVVRQ